MRRGARRCAIVCVCVCNWVCVRACRWGCECECRCSECMKTRQNERLGCKKVLKKRDSLISATFSPNNLGLKPPFFRGRVRSVTSSSASAVSRDVSAEMFRPDCFGLKRFRPLSLPCFLSRLLKNRHGLGSIAI